MRRFDKSKHIETLNKNLEKRSLIEKGFIKEDRDYDDGHYTYFEESIIKKGKNIVDEK